MRTDPFLLVNKDRYGWSEIDVAQFERARRRGAVDTFERARSYWSVMNYLNKRPAYTGHPFLTIGEAARCFQPVIAGKTFSDMRALPLVANMDDLRQRYVVARYFARRRFARPEAWN